MKKILLGLFFAMFAMQVNAATYSLYNTLGDAQGAVSSVDSGSSVYGFQGVSGAEDNVAGDTTFSWFLTVDPTQASAVLNGASPSLYVTLSNVAVTSVSGSDIGSVIDTSSNLISGDLSVMGTLLSGSIYEVALDFFVADGKGGSIDINVSSVPVPAAVWLFGSALMGLFGVSRRKSTAVAA